MGIEGNAVVTQPHQHLVVFHAGKDIHSLIPFRFRKAVLYDIIRHLLHAETGNHGTLVINAVFLAESFEAFGYINHSVHILDRNREFIRRFKVGRKIDDIHEGNRELLLSDDRPDHKEGKRYDLGDHVTCPDAVDSDHLSQEDTAQHRCDKAVEREDHIAEAGPAENLIDRHDRNREEVERCAPGIVAKQSDGGGNDIPFGAEQHRKRCSERIGDEKADNADGDAGQDAHIHSPLDQRL